MLTACAAAGAVLSAIGPVASASASDASIKHVMEIDLPKILNEEAKFTTALSEYEKTGDVTPVESALDSNIEVVRMTRSEIVKQRAQSKRAKSAKAMIKTALARVIRAYRRLKVAFGVKRSNPSAAKKQAKKAVAAIRKADRELVEAALLLG